MEKQDSAEIRVIFDQQTHSATVSVGELSAPIPFPIYSQREANVMGREFARNLGWLTRTPSTTRR